MARIRVEQSHFGSNGHPSPRTSETTRILVQWAFYENCFVEIALWKPRKRFSTDYFQYQKRSSCIEIRSLGIHSAFQLLIPDRNSRNDSVNDATVNIG